MSIFETTLKEAGFNEPFDRDAELSVICMMLRSDQALGQAIDTLSKEMFYDIDCSSLFETISKIWYDNNRDICAPEIRLRIVPKVLTSLGLTSDKHCVSHDKFLGLLETIKEHHIRRRLIHCAYGLFEDAFDANLPISKLEDSAERLSRDLWLAFNEVHKLSYSSPIGEMINIAIEDVVCHRNVGFPSGFKELDKITNGWRERSVTLLAARPAIGIRPFSLTMARNSAVYFNIPTAYICTLGNIKEIVNQLISGQTNIPYERLCEIDALTGDDAALFEQNLKTLCNAPLHICTTSNSLSELFAAIRNMVKDKGVRAVYIDEIESLYNESILDATNFDITLRFLKYVAQRFSIAIIATHSFHPENLDIAYEEPSIKALRKSGISDKFADVVVMLHYIPCEHLDEENEIGKTKVIVGKNVFGPGGEFFVRYNLEKRMFENYIDLTPEIEDFLNFIQNEFEDDDFS